MLLSEIVSQAQYPISGVLRLFVVKNGKQRQELSKDRMAPAWMQEMMRDLQELEKVA